MGGAPGDPAFPRPGKAAGATTFVGSGEGAMMRFMDPS